MSDPDFEEQLRQEQLEKEKTEEDRGTYTDEDGTVFEWDGQKKAWFPKIDADFIAQYQLNYGGPPTEDTEKEGKKDDGKTEEEKRKEYEQYCKDYYNYYADYYNQQSGENGNNDEEQKEGEAGDGPGGDNSAKGDNSKEEPYSYDDYFEYYKYYYGENSGEGQSGEGEKEDEKVEEKKESDKPKAGEKRKEGWFEHDSEKSAHVYVSNLPLDITDEEYKELMSKCGLIMHDPGTRKPKLKLYRDHNKEPKGDGLCCYIKQESVQLALNILDGSEVRGHKISVERAQFQMKGQYDPSKKRRKLTNKDKRKLKEKQEKLFDWRPEKEEARLKCEKTVILKNMFDPKEFEENPMVINELRDDVRLEAAKFGEVKKVTVFDRNSDGVISVKYKEAEEADKCIAGLNGRWFAQQRIIASAWDGVTKYEIEETEEERNARLQKWEGFLNIGASTSSSPGASSSVTSDSAASSTVAMDTSSVPAVTSPVSAVTSSVPAVTSSVPALTKSKDSGEKVEGGGKEGDKEDEEKEDEDEEKEDEDEEKEDTGETKEDEGETRKEGNTEKTSS
ncbi:17S U2 SnRNP complex component HTATSF1-like [Haliotis cracherodii]|uniref:17S U2 SnRNP complex component HTATSF1-like n=1 Tax=Haliotis cracherodii TaxID=6455 RepID=UPI0039EA85E9